MLSILLHKQFAHLQTDRVVTHERVEGSNLGSGD